MKKRVNEAKQWDGMSVEQHKRIIANMEKQLADMKKQGAPARRGGVAPFIPMGTRPGDYHMNVVGLAQSITQAKADLHRKETAKRAGYDSWDEYMKHVAKESIDYRGRQTMKKSQLRELIREVIAHELREQGASPWTGGRPVLQNINDLKTFLTSYAKRGDIDDIAAAIIWNNAEYNIRHGTNFHTAMDKAIADFKAERDRYARRVHDQRPGVHQESVINEELTRKDFVLMAQEIRKAAPQHQDVLTRFAIVLAKTQNPRFDEERFRAAIESGKGI
jgi:hypothetical protein